MLFALNVFVSIISAPASRYFCVNFTNNFGLGKTKQIVVPFEQIGPIGKTATSIVFFLKIILLDHCSGCPRRVQEFAWIECQAGRFFVSCITLFLTKIIKNEYLALYHVIKTDLNARL
jgi:hypothetical protein